MTERMLTLYTGAGPDAQSEAMTTLQAGLEPNAGVAVDGDGGDGGDGGVGRRGKAYYAIESGAGVAQAGVVDGAGLSPSPPSTLDNPDQRIAEDVRSFTKASLQLGLTIIRAFIDLASFSAILYSIYPVLFGVIIAYASIGTLVTVTLGGQLVELNYQLLRREADFRFALVRVRENAESIAFYGGEGLERAQASDRPEVRMRCAMLRKILLLATSTYE